MYYCFCSICLICYYWECAECRCSVYLWSLEIGLYVWVSGWNGGAESAPIRQTYCYYYQCTYCFCVESNDESSGEMTVNWKLLVMILVCRCVRLLQSYWCGWLVDWWLKWQVIFPMSGSLHLWRQQIWRLSSYSWRARRGWSVSMRLFCCMCVKYALVLSFLCFLLKLLSSLWCS